MSTEQKEIVELALEKLASAYKLHPSGASEIYAAEKVVEFLMGMYS